MKENDILGEIDLWVNEISHNDEVQETQNTIDSESDTSWDTDFNELLADIHSIADEIIEEKDEEMSESSKKDENKTSFITKICSFSIFLVKYAMTSALIFWLLLVTTNYEAYYNILYSHVNKDKMVQKQESLLNSVQATYIKEHIVEQQEEEVVVNDEEIEANLEIDRHSVSRLVKEAEKEKISLDIEITPYENRIIIPKIGKNIPLLDVANSSITGEDELNDIFMKELEGGVVRYPGSVKPWNNGNTFIFWHSSNFPWMDGEYNDVFSLLDNVVYEDEIIVYYGQKQYKYKIREKAVIDPGDVSLLKRNKKKNEITLMTCWPIGTTIDRLIVIWELIEEE